MKNSSPKLKSDKAVTVGSGQQLPQKRELTNQELADIHLPALGRHVYMNQLASFASGPEMERASSQFIKAALAKMKPRDPMEEMLILQSIWTYARVGKLSILANQQTGTHAMKVVTDACDRAAMTYRRQMLALAEYRRPLRSDGFMAIKQANLAQQQVVQNVEKPNSQKPGESNEKGFVPRASESPALPSHPKWSGYPTGGDSNHKAVEIHNRTENAEGQRAVEDERAEARGA